MLVPIGITKGGLECKRLLPGCACSHWYHKRRFTFKRSVDNNRLRFLAVRVSIGITKGALDIDDEVRPSSIVGRQKKTRRVLGAF